MNAKVIVVAGALLLLPAAAASQPFSSTTVVEGHTVFVQLSPEGSDLAAVAGSVQCQVLWFNNQVLFRVNPGSSGLCGDARFVYAYPGNAPDPRGNPTLKPTGRQWDFTDPNGAYWHVLEYEYRQLQVTVNQHLGLPDFVVENITLEALNYTAWIVEAGPAVYEPTVQQDYNFVLLVDTSKIALTQKDAVHHDGTPSSPAGGNSHDNTRLDQPGLATHPHRHDKSWVTLGLGDVPPLWS